MLLNLYLIEINALNVALNYNQRQSAKKSAFSMEIFAIAVNKINILLYYYCPSYI